MSNHSARLAKLEQSATAHQPPAGPGYVSAPSMAEMPAALAEYAERWPGAGTVKGFIGVSPDDWGEEKRAAEQDGAKKEWSRK